MKKIYLLLLLLLLTGCSVNYEVDFSNDKVEERISGYVTNKEYENDPDATDLNVYSNFLDFEQCSLIDGDDKYKKVIDKKGNKINYEYYYTYNNNEDNSYANSRILNICFDNYVFYEDDDYFYISLDGEYSCNLDDKINISLTTDNKVLDSNAKIYKNKFTWTIDDSNKDDVDIYIKISKDEKTNNSEFLSKFKMVGLIVFGILVIISGLLFYKLKKNNKI